MRASEAGSGVHDTAADPLHPALVRRALDGCRFGARVHYRRSTGSTNDDAHELGRAGCDDGTIIVADEQTTGRGRRRRAWLSPPGVGLYVSVVLRPPVPPAEAGPAVQLAAGIAVAETVGRHAAGRPSLHWPNDCYYEERKIAGVLVEAEATAGELDFLVCGIGVNVNHSAADFPQSLRRQVTSLRLLLGHPVPRLAVLVGLLRALDEWENVWRRHGMGPIRDRWLELSPDSQGGSVAVQTEAGLLRGTAEGLDEGGALRVRVADRIHTITVGEVVRSTPTEAAR